MEILGGGGAGDENNRGDTDWDFAQGCSAISG